MMRIAGFLVAFALFWSGASAGETQLSASQREAAVSAILAALKEKYVFPEKVAAISEALNKAKAAGRYDTADPVAFATRISEDFDAASHDRHLYLHYDRAQFEARKTGKGDDGDASVEAYYRAKAVRENSGLAELKILPGNIRYLRITGFQWDDDETGPAYDAAMRFLKDGDAAIIDIRSNGGGAHSAVRYLLSHFLKSDAPLMTFHAAGEAPKQSYTLEHLPAGRLMGKPLAVLIDGHVASAAEEFAYSVQQFHCGVLVGAKTAGAANNNVLVPIAPGFILSVSYGYPEHPVTHGNWEGAGVSPDIEAGWAQSLDIAETVLLKKLLAAKPASAIRAEYEWALSGANGRLAPPNVSQAELAKLAGHYGKRGEVVFRDGALSYLAGPDGPWRHLTPLTADGWFVIEGWDDLRFRFTPAGIESYLMGDPNPLRMPRQ